MEFTISEKIPSVCLNMIVKNEAHIIQETLTKLCNKIKFSYWVICDTGSTDETPELIIEFFKNKGIAGEIFYDEWASFSHNRSLALSRAFQKTDLLLVFDADDEIIGEISMPTEVAYDEYQMQFGSELGLSYTRVLLINNRKPFEYKSVIHEFITCKEPGSKTTLLEGNYYVVSGRGSARNKDPEKYLKDAKILEAAYEEAKKSEDLLFHRYAFYCANSYKDYGRLEDAIKWYKITLSHENQWDQEKYMSCVSIYECFYGLKQQENGFFYLVKAFSHDKERVECLYHLVNHYCSIGMNEIAYYYYLMCKDFYENRYLSTNIQTKLFIQNDKYDLYLPYYMILVADKVKEIHPEARKTISKMFEIIFTKKTPVSNDFFIGNILFNLQFFMEIAIQNIPNFLNLFQSYIYFLENMNINLAKYDFLNIYENLGIVFKHKKFVAKKFSKEECEESKKILIYTGFSNKPWNYTYSINNALGGSETAVCNLAKCFPENYEIYIGGSVEEEVINNIHFVNFDTLGRITKEYAFNTLIVSRYLAFYEMFPETSFHKSFIWGHDIMLFNYGCNLDVNQILNKWSNQIHGCICQTIWHKDLFQSLYPQLNEKLYVINNGIEIERFSIKNRKIENRFIYSSCTERGLDRLLELWPNIIKELPNAELYICSYNSFPINEYENSLNNIIQTYENIKHVGSLNRDKLYNLMSTCEYWLYPTNFSETSCITSMEMLMSEIICVYYPLAGLINTLGDYGIPVERGSEVETIVSLTNKKKSAMRKSGKEYALSCSWENRFQNWSNIIFENQEREQLIPIKVINLKRREDRKTSMKEQFERKNITNYEFVDAVDGVNLEESEELRLLFEGNDFNYKKGVIGCSLSHIYLWNQLINDDNSEFYVILEDDIQLCENFKEKLEAACDMFRKQNIDHLSLGNYSTNSKFNEVCEKLEIIETDPYHTWNSSFSNIVSKNAAKKMIKHINSCSIKVATDNPQAYGNRIKYYGTNYPLVKCEMYSETFATDIQGNRADDFFVFDNVDLINESNKISISFCDWWTSEYCGGSFEFDNNFITRILSHSSKKLNINVVPAESNPDILFYSIFGNSHKDYKAGRKVFFSGEPYGCRDDADYNLTFDDNNDKNTRFPLWLAYTNNYLLEESLRRKNGGLPNVPDRKKFCSFIASGPGLENNRKDFVEKLSKYKNVECGGNYLNNIGGNIPLGTNCSGKIEHNNQYKFAVAFESTNYPGYVTEKICDVYKSNCIPIYWGTKDVVRDFNPTTFINANDFSTFEELIEHVIKVDNDDTLYASYFKEPIFSNKWMDVLNDPNKTFYKNLTDHIIGKSKNLVINYFENVTSVKEKWVIYGPGWVFPLVKDFVANLNTRFNVTYVTDTNQIKNICPVKILFINNVHDDSVFKTFPNVEISILNIDSLCIPYFLNYIFLMNYLYPGIKVYDYSRENIKILEKNGIQCSYLEYVYDEKEINFLREVNCQPKIYDFGIICYSSDASYYFRRKKIVDLLREKGFSVNVATGFEKERDIELGKCKIILNIHQQNYNVECKTFEHIRCNRLLFAGFKILSETSIIDEDFASKFLNLKFLHYDDFENISKEQVESFNFNTICKTDESQYKPHLKVYNIWHNKLFDNCYEKLDDYSLSKLTMFDVNTKYQKIYNAEKNYNIVKEYEMPHYNSLYQDTNYCQTSALYHIFKNKIYFEYDYVGFIQYDMELEKDFIYDMEQKMKKSKNDTYFYSLIVANKLDIPLICNPYNNSILEKYNEYFKTSHTHNSIKSHKNANNFICLHTFVIPTKIFIKMMTWFCTLTDWLHANYINGLYFESISEVTEEIFGLFLLLQIIENDSIQLEEMKLNHNWPNLHNENNFNNYKERLPHFSLDKIVDNKLTDKNTWHSYLNTYERLLKDRQQNCKNVLEIGIEKGGSLKLWNDYFVNANIYGIDINDSPNFLKEFKRVQCLKMNAYSDESIEYFKNKNIKFDLIVDDGPHTLETMIYFVQNYLQLLETDGVMVVEDIPDISWCEEFKKFVPKYCDFEIVDLRNPKNIYDDILFVIRKNKNIVEKNDDLWLFYAFEGHNFKVLEDYIESLNEKYNIVYTQDAEYVLSCNPKKVTFVMNVSNERIIEKYKNTDVELSILNTEPLTISHNLDLLKGYIANHPYLKIYDYSFSNTEIILRNGMTSHVLKYIPSEKEIRRLKKLNASSEKIYDFGIITYGNTKTNTIDSLIHKKRDIVESLLRKGFKIHIISGWGEERDIELAKCKVILNIHSILGINGNMYYSKTFENIRCNRLLDSGFKILSEDSIHCNELVEKYPNLKFVAYSDFQNIEYSSNFWDSIVSNNIKKYCFIHSCNLENVGTHRLNNLIEKLVETECINIFDKIYINNIGLPIENIYGEKFEVINFSNDARLFETPTINFMRDFSEKNPNSYILYLHTKGIRYLNDDYKINDWINYMLCFLVDEHKNCISLLDNYYDAVGCNYSNDLSKEYFAHTNPFPPSHYSGNFWWANTNYLRHLPILSLENIERSTPEFWLFKNNPVFYNLHSSNVNHYYDIYPKKEYYYKKFYNQQKSCEFIETKFNALCNTYLDINEHLPTLCNYAKECESIIECGVRGCVSSWAFAYGLLHNKSSIKKMLLNDIEPCDIKEFLTTTNEIKGLQVNYWWCSDLDLNITENVDLVFIDTLHVYGQLKRELDKFGKIANKYIIMHDTTVDEIDGECIRMGWDAEKMSKTTGFPEEELNKGLKFAINEFLYNNRDWVLHEVFINNNGLTILKKIVDHKKKLLPISFSVPEEKICKLEGIFNKTKIDSLVKPFNDRNQPYLYNNEGDYYEDYKTSFFAKTCKRNGWDALRHYEIVANNCLPYFHDLHECPENALCFYPKALIQRANDLYEKVKDLEVTDLVTNYDFINTYTDLLNQLSEHTKKNLTTKNMANYILESSNNKLENEKLLKVLFLSADEKDDFLKCLTLHGFKSIFGSRCHDYPKIPSIYKSCTSDKLGGNGFTYSRLLEDTYRNESIDSSIVDDIKSKKYDLIIYSQANRACPFYDIVSQIYEPSKVIFFNGEDHVTHFHLKDFHEKISKGHFCYIREFHEFNNYDYFIPFIKYFMRQ